MAEATCASSGTWTGCPSRACCLCAFSLILVAIRNNLLKSESVVAFHLVGPRDRTRVGGLGSEHLHRLSHLAGPPVGYLLCLCWTECTPCVHKLIKALHWTDQDIIV